MKRLFRGAPPSAPFALLSDFGVADAYVGTMKGTILSIQPSARFVDISHSVEPGKILSGAYLLWSCYRYFPLGTIFVAVVDPGVGTKRHIVLARAAGRWFLGPDNGLLDLVLGEETPEISRQVRIEGSPYVLSEVSRTFHGRDVFAPMAAYLSRGVAPEEFGPATIPVPRSLPWCRPRTSRGIALHVDRFGNIITNVPLSEEAPVSVSVRSTKVRQWIHTYEEAPGADPCLIRGSSGLMEIVRKNASASARLKLKSGDTFGVHWR
jgi:hypothetical protein